MLENNHQFDTHELETLANHAFSHRFNHTLHAYIDIAEDLVAGVLLSQIIYWFTPDQHGRRKVRVIKDGHYWLAKQQEEWYAEIRITAKQYRTAAKKLEDKKLIIKTVYKFDGKPTTHIRPNYPVLREEIRKWKNAVMQELMGNENPFLTKGKKPITPSVFDDAEQQLGYLEQGATLETQGESPNPLGDMVFDQKSKTKLTKGQKGNLPKVKNFNRDYNKDNQTNGDCLIDEQTKQEATDFLNFAIQKGMNIQSTKATKKRYLEARAKGIDHETLMNGLKEAFKRHGKATSPVSVVQVMIDNRIAAEEAATAAMAEVEEKERRRRENEDRARAAMIAAGINPQEVGY